MIKIKRYLIERLKNLKDTLKLWVENGLLRQSDVDALDKMVHVRKSELKNLIYSIVENKFNENQKLAEDVINCIDINEMKYVTNLFKSINDSSTNFGIIDFSDIIENENCEFFSKFCSKWQNTAYSMSKIYTTLFGNVVGNFEILLLFLLKNAKKTPGCDIKIDDKLKIEVKYYGKSNGPRIGGYKVNEIKNIKIGNEDINLRSYFKNKGASNELLKVVDGFNNNNSLITEFFTKLYENTTNQYQDTQDTDKNIKLDSERIINSAITYYEKHNYSTVLLDIYGAFQLIAYYRQQSFTNLLMFRGDRNIIYKCIDFSALLEGDIISNILNNYTITEGLGNSTNVCRFKFKK